MFRLRHAPLGVSTEEGDGGVPIILTGIAVAIAIAIGAGYLMRSEQEPAWQVYSTDSTRVGDPGHNLVGPEWQVEQGDGSSDNAAS